ncbi:related to putative cystathionine beta-lyase [Cephalotrichum gorgonifer]|uniref:Related to putative cystathionine beta-lyase n=1 Tax=Cephalotrichum gorgonifer TaxID=2041049 RepID=A0AAE8MQT5_9PEZI|nr:related to putative cystathionine beta-lyase [Cephalotrichum gorgonifer]
MAGSENEISKGAPPGLAKAEPKRELALASRSIHADDNVSAHRAVAPAMHVSTTFRYSDNPDDLGYMNNQDPSAPKDSHIYSRISSPNLTRLEILLSSLLNGPSVTYSSGLSAFHALLVRLNPRRIAISAGYHGCHGVIDLVSRLSGLEVVPLDCPASDLGPGDVIHVETPLNPTGEAADLEHYAKKARESGAYLTVDATFAPPPLQDPLVQGADIVMHSGTKYIGGHSDLLCGVLTVNPRLAGPDAAGGVDLHAGLLQDRIFLGSVMGNLEGWLGLRSLRTLELRVTRQSSSATSLVRWLAAEAADSSSLVSRAVDSVQHASLQPGAEAEGSWLRRQMPGGFGPVFAIRMKEEALARALPSKLELFHHATSLGGVESLIEWRAMTDKSVDKRLLRVSIGLEAWEDLRDDLIAGFRALLDA